MVTSAAEPFLGLNDPTIIVSVRHGHFSPGRLSTPITNKFTRWLSVAVEVGFGCGCRIALAVGVGDGMGVEEDEATFKDNRRVGELV